MYHAQVYGDVCRPPPHLPVLAALLGTGVRMRVCISRIGCPFDICNPRVRHVIERMRVCISRTGRPFGILCNPRVRHVTERMRVCISCMGRHVTARRCSSR